jgi:hypothetical protein
VSRVEDLLGAALRSLPSKPADDASRNEKQYYSQQLTNVIAEAFAEELRERGLSGARPGPPGVVGLTGAERRMSGGIGAKRVDVTWATEESGLLLAVSLKSINFVDRQSGNYQKNLTNRRGDLLFESVTLHRRFPYAVLAGFLFLDQGAAEDDSATRRSTYLNAHHRLQLFTGRRDPSARDEQYELLCIALHDANAFSPSVRFSEAGEPDQSLPLEDVFDMMVNLIAERNPDFYEAEEGNLRNVR